MLLRPRVWLVSSALLALTLGCSSGVHDEVKKEEKPAAKTGEGTAATSSSGTAGKESKPSDTPEEKATPPRGDGTARIAAIREKEIEKAEAKIEKAKAEARRATTLSGKPPAADDTLNLYYPNDPDTINPITSSDTTSENFQRWVYEGLAESDMSDPDKLKPSLAERWEFDEKTLEFKIYLRKNVKWHPMKLPNGEMLPAKEFTSRDVKFSFDCLLNKNIDAASLRSYFEDSDAKDETQRIKIKVTVIGDYEIKIKWTKPYFLIKEFTLAAVSMIPRHVYSVDANGKPISFDFGSKEFADGFNNHWANKLMCGTGPMMFKTWKKDDRLEVVRNPDYWDAPFYFSKVIFRNIPNPNTSTNLVLQNELDWAAIAEKDRYMQVKDNPNVKAGKVKLDEFAYPAFRYIGYNLRRGEFLKEKKVRWALSHAIPLDTIIKEVYKGLAKRTSGPFLAGSSAYNESVPLIPFDLETSKKLLDEAGWKDTDDDGVRDKTINNVKVQAKFDLMIPADSPQALTVVEIFKENCRKVGIDLQISPAKWASMLQRLRKKEFDACMLGWALSWRQDPYQIWHGSQADLPESSNSIGYQNAELDKLIEELRVTLDEKKQVGLYHKMHRIIYDDQPYTFLFIDLATGAHHSRLQNIKFYKVRPCIDQREWYSTLPRKEETK